jgi:hypothetical protein
MSCVRQKEAILIELKRFGTHEDLHVNNSDTVKPANLKKLKYLKALNK